MRTIAQERSRRRSSGPRRARVPRRRPCFALLVGATTLAGAVALARGASLDDVDFSLRFPAAVTRFASYADVAAMGGAQAASEWSTSLNPASAAWPHASTRPLALSPQGTQVRFAAGTRLQVTSEAVTLTTTDAGVFLPAAAQVRSNHRADRSGTGFEFSADYFQLQWAKSPAPGTAIGLNANITRSDTRLDFSGTPLAHTRAWARNLRAGVVRRLRPALRAGAVVDYTRSPEASDLWLAGPGDQPQNLHAEDTTSQALARVGLAWEYARGCTFSLDYQAGRLANATGRLRVHRFPLGIEHALFHGGLFLRGGVTLDTRGDVVTTAGAGLALGEHASVDVAWQHNPFPEIRREFGGAAGWTLSLSAAF